MSFAINLPGVLEKALVGAAAARGVAAEEYAISALTKYLESDNEDIPLDEAGLLLEINRGFPAYWWSRYKEFVQKRQNGTLSPSEIEELIHRTDELEVYGARRLQCLTELAKIRETGIDDLMEALELRPFELTD